MAQETDSDSDSIPMGRPGGDDDEMIFVPVVAHDIDMDSKRPTITTQTGNVALRTMNGHVANGGLGSSTTDQKVDSDDEDNEDDGTRIVQYDGIYLSLFCSFLCFCFLFLFLFSC